MLLEDKTKTGFFFPLSADELFCKLTPQSLESLTKIKRLAAFRKDTVIFAAGDATRFIHILQKGQAKLSVNADSDLVRLVEPDEILGLTERMANLPCEMNLETITPCVFELIEIDNFLRFLQGEPEICFRLVKMLVLNLQKRRLLVCSLII